MRGTDKTSATFKTKKGLISRTYKKLLQINKKKTGKDSRRWIKNMNRKFTEGKILNV